MSLFLYTVGLVILCTGLYFVRKSDEKLNAVTYLVFTVVLFMIIQAVEAGIISRISVIGISAAVFGALHIVEGAVLWYLIFVKKCRQGYYFDIADVRVLVVLAVLVAVVAVRQFGVYLDNFNFWADSDGARHYMFARNVADRGQLIGLFFSALNSGLAMNALKGIVSDFFLYRVFILFEVWILFLNGAIFWTLIRGYLNDKFSIISGMAVTVAYTLGYPWNSMVFGTSYLSTGIVCVAVILFLMDIFYYDRHCSNKGVLVLLVFGCYALLHSYSLFIPPVLAGIFLMLIFKSVATKHITKQKAGIIVSVVFILCLVMGTLFLYIWSVRGIESAQLEGLSLWGRMYGALYADFLFVIPFGILWLVRTIRAKQMNVECMVIPIFLLYILVFFVTVYLGKISAYYYYKTYYILWIVAFMVVAKALAALKQERPFVLSYIFTWTMLFFVFISSVEKRLPKEYNLDLLEPSGGRLASDYFGLYDYNMKYSHENQISMTKKELYMEAAKISAQTGEFIPYVGKYMDNEWTYFALAGKEHVNVLEGKNYAAAVEELQKYSHILYVDCEESTVNVDKFLKMFPVVYENEAGKIYKVDSDLLTAKSLIGDKEVDIISRYGLPKLERMGWVEQDEYVNSLQVIKKMEKLGVDKTEFLYPELEMEKLEDSFHYTIDEADNNRQRIVFDGITSRELQQIIDEYPGAVIDIHSKQIELNETIMLKNNTMICGNGVKIAGNGLEYAFLGEGVSNISLNDICLTGKINYGIYLIDCRQISISGCQVNGMMQKAVCVIGDTKEVNVCGNDICNNNAGGLYVAGDVSKCFIEDNKISGNGGISQWMSGIVLTGIVPEDKYDIWKGFDKGHNNPQRDSVYDQIECPHEICIRNNEISNNSSKGIYLDGAYKGYVIGNTICENMRGGLALHYGTMGFYVEGNYLESNGESMYSGVELDNAAYNILRNNIITDQYIGINMEQASVRNLIMENVVRGGEAEVCHQYGIAIGTGITASVNMDSGSGYENVICRNSIMGNHDSGIFIDEGCYVNDVFDNVIMEVRTFSVEALSSMFNSIINNTSNTGEWIAYQQ